MVPCNRKILQKSFIITWNHGLTDEAIVSLDTHVWVVDGELEEHGPCVLVYPASSLELSHFVVDGSAVTPKLGDVPPTTIHMQLAVDWIGVDVDSTAVCVLIRTNHLHRQHTSTSVAMQTLTHSQYDNNFS